MDFQSAGTIAGNVVEGLLSASLAACAQSILCAVAETQSPNSAEQKSHSRFPAPSTRHPISLLHRAPGYADTTRVKHAEPNSNPASIKTCEAYDRRPDAEWKREEL
jgi:hypothetical protein